MGTGTGFYKILNENSGLLLAAATGSTNAVVQIRDDGGDVGLLDAVPNKDGQRLVNKLTGQALTESKEQVVQSVASNGASQNQRWMFAPAADLAANGVYAVTNVNSGLNLDTQNAATAPRTLTVQNASNGAADQKWELEPTGTGCDHIVQQSSGLLLGIQNGTTSRGAYEAIGTADNTLDQDWQVGPDGAGSSFVLRGRSTKSCARARTGWIVVVGLSF